MRNKPFWKSKTMHQMNSDEWESLCDGCGRCCLHKLEDEDSRKIYFTDVACHYLDEEDALVRTMRPSKLCSRLLKY